MPRLIPNLNINRRAKQLVNAGERAFSENRILDGLHLYDNAISVLSSEYDKSGSNSSLLKMIQYSKRAGEKAKRHGFEEPAVRFKGLNNTYIARAQILGIKAQQENLLISEVKLSDVERIPGMSIRATSGHAIIEQKDYERYTVKIVVDKGGWRNKKIAPEKIKHWQNLTIESVKPLYSTRKPPHGDGDEEETVVTKSIVVKKTKLNKHWKTK